MSKKLKKLTAILAVIAIVTAAYYVWSSTRGYETGVATLSDVLNSESERKIENTLTIVSDNPYFTLIGTPVSLYYEGPERKASPLLVVNEQNNSRAIIRFLNQYNTTSVITIGDVPSALYSNEREWEPIEITLSVETAFKGSTEDISLDVAKHFWKKSDGVILIKNDQEGYNQAVVAVPLASYVNVPVIVTDKVDSNVADVLEDLDVKYSLVCGDMRGYKKTKHFNSIEEIQDWTISVIRQRLKDDVSYITMANPLDIHEPTILETSTPIDVKGEEIVNVQAEGYPGAPPSELTGPIHYFDVNYKYANVKIELTMDLSKEYFGDDSGARIYAFLGIDGNEDGELDEGSEEDHIKFFGGSPAYKIEGLTSNPIGGILGVDTYDGEPKSDYAYYYTEYPIFNDMRKHAIQLLAKLPSSGLVDGNLNPDDGESTYDLRVTVEKLEDYIYPRLNDASSLAPYLIAYRKGVVLAKPNYMIYSDSYVETKDSSNPATNLELTETTNKRVKEVKEDLNNLLGRIAGMPTKTNSDVIALADYYHSLNENGNYTYLGIITDPSMVPPFYYRSYGVGLESLEGYNMPSDNMYADIDADPDNEPYSFNEGFPRLELADGRISGFDVQDVSALLSRTFFYYDILDKMEVWEQRGTLGSSWKDNGFGNIGTEPPVGAAGTARHKVGEMWRAADFTVDIDSRNRQLAGKQDAAPLYESSNFIYICAHGFYYWYVPTASRSAMKYFDNEGGGAFDVAHVRLMNFGPSVMWASSCVTSRLDGLEPYNALSNAFSHAGMNTYIGGVRSMYGVLIPQPDARSGEKLGDLMMLYFYGHLTGYIYDKSSDNATNYMPNDISVGASLMFAKNEYMVSQLEQQTDKEVEETYEVVRLHGDPAFNPYEPNHEGGG